MAGSLPWTDLVARNAAQHGALVAGIDPNLADIPAVFQRGGGDWIGRYVTFVLDAIHGQVGFVKFQSAYFEAEGLAGMRALSRGLAQARAAGIGAILDAKRGDIGDTAAAYARAYLTPPAAGGSEDFEADCLTVNPYMGPDTLLPFVQAARRHGKGLFILCRTSNPGAAWLQDQPATAGAVSDHVACLIAELAGEGSGLSPIGAVIGATAADHGRRLRALMPRAIILAPGLGAQGADPAALGGLRGGRHGDLLAPVSRGLLRAPDRHISEVAYAALIMQRIAAFKREVDGAGPGH